MKTRNGFVSNSSTSSFVVMVPTEVVEKVQENMTIFARARVDHVRTDKKFMGKDVSIFNGTMGDCSSWDNFRDDEFPHTEEEADHTWDIWENFLEKLQEGAGEDYIYFSEEC